MSTLTDKKNWLDFDAIKADADVTAILSYYGLLERLEQRSNEFVGWCPLGTKRHGKRDSFNFNVKKKTFKCFACKQHGSTLDFVAKYQGLHLREAGEVLVMISNDTAPVGPPPRDDPEELPDSLVDPASEASEQTEGLTQLAETEGSAVRFPSADDPATVPVGLKIVDSKPADYLLSFQKALELVNSGKIHHSQFIVIDKVVFSQFIKEIEDTMAQK